MGALGPGEAPTPRAQTPAGRPQRGTWPIRSTRAERRRLTLASVLSVLMHALLVSLSFGGQGLGLPGIDLPWRERRVEAPDLRIVLMPAQSPIPIQTATVASKPVQPPATVQSAAVNPILVMAEGSAAPQGPDVPAGLPAARPLAPGVEPRAATETGRTAAPAAALAKEPSERAPAPIPDPAVIAVKRPADTEWVVAAEASKPTPVTSAASSASSPTPLAPVGEPAGDVQKDRVNPAAQEQAAEGARRERMEQEAARQAVLLEEARQEAARQDARRIETARLEADRQEALRQQAAEQEAARQEARRIEAERLEAERLEAARQRALRQQAARQEAAREDAQRIEAARLEAARQAAMQQQVEKQAAARQEAARIEAERLETARQEAARKEAARQEAVRQEAVRQEAVRQEAARQEVARQEAARQEAARQEAARQEAARQEAVRKEAARQEATRQEAARQEAARQEAARAEAARQTAQRAEAAQAEDARREAIRRAIGRQLDEEAARRDAAASAAGPSSARSPSASSVRRGRLFGRADANAELVLYAEAFARKIQLNMTFDMIREAAKRPHTQPLVTVAIRSDGSIESVSFVLSSGVAEIDAAIRRIVESQAPYQAFPPALAREFDVVEIRRSWHFDTAIRLY